MLDGAKYSLDIDIRPSRLDLVRRHGDDVDVDRAGNAGIVHIFVPAIPGPGHADVGDLTKTGVHAGFLRQFAIEPDGIFMNLADRIAHIEERQQAGGMPGRAGCQFLALHKNDIRPTLAGQVIKRGDADNTASDDDDTGFAFHVSSLSWQAVPASFTRRHAA